MARSKPDDVKVTTGGGLSVMGEITLSSGGKTVNLGGNPTEHSPGCHQSDMETRINHDSGR